MTQSLTPRLEASGVSLGYDRGPVVDGLDLALPESQVTVIIGPNGCGKSTLLRGLGRLMRPARGQVLLDGRDIHAMPTRRVAQLVGLLPQQSNAPEGISVRELVGRGRYPHQGWFGRSGAHDDEVVAEALVDTSTLDYAERPVDELSGGQRQRVWIAMALAQRPDILLLDEPTTYLDIAHQVEILDLVCRLNRERGTTVVMVLHDLNLAARYADHLVVMAEGEIRRRGAPAECLTAETVQDAFGLEAVVVADPVTGCPLVVPAGDPRMARASA
jgi:iron complex transport system ATP-binding protein